MNRSTRIRRPEQGAFVASGEMIDLGDQATIHRLSVRRQTWQDLAWNYRELVGELGAGIGRMSDILSKVEYQLGQRQPQGAPVPLDSDKCTLSKAARDAGQAAMARLPLDGGWDFAGIAYTCFKVAGECWMYGRTDTDDLEDWSVLSNDEVVAFNGRLAIKVEPDMQPEPLQPGAVLLRLWKPHPRWKPLADSPVRRLLDTCEDIVLIGRELRAASRSRVAANGILLIPNSVELVRGGDRRSDFQTKLEAVMLAPIRDEGDPGAVVPVVLKGSPEDLEKVRHLVLHREDSKELVAKQQAALVRLREGMDMPPEMGTGVGDTNHWNAWAISSATWRDYLEPDARMLGDAVTRAYLWRSVMAPEDAGGGGLSAVEARQMVLFPDGGSITSNADQGADARELYDRGEINGKTLREAHQFGEDAAPDEGELRRMLGWRQANALPPEAVLELLAKAAGISPAGMQVDTPRGTAVGRREVISITGARADEPVAEPGRNPNQPTPRTRPRAVTASAAPTVRVVTGEQLADIERQLRERLTTAAEEALHRVAEKAGARVRSAAQRDPELAGQLSGVDADQVCALVGRDRIAELGIGDERLLADAFVRLGRQFTDWCGAAVKASTTALGELVGAPLTAVSTLAQRMMARIPAAWDTWHKSLRERALDVIHGRERADDPRGEVPDSWVQPAALRAALGVIGGDRGTGSLALGADILGEATQHAEPVGFTWRYGVTPRASQFHPHRRLNGQRLSGWDDERLATAGTGYEWVGPRFAVADHDGCLCDYVPAWAMGADSPNVELARDVSEPDERHPDRILAAMDDAAGRRGTVAQGVRDEQDRIAEVAREWLARSG